MTQTDNFIARTRRVDFSITQKVVGTQATPSPHPSWITAEQLKTMYQGTLVPRQLKCAHLA